MMGLEPLLEDTRETPYTPKTRGLGQSGQNQFCRKGTAMQLKIRPRSRYQADRLGQQRVGAAQALRHNTDRQRSGCRGLGQRIHWFF